MFGRSRRPGPKTHRATSAPNDTIVWAVGDIHGQDDLFEAMAVAIEGDVAQCRAARRVVVLLGDYVDRGLGSRRVIERVFKLRRVLAESGADLVLLKGNHEDLLLRFIDDHGTGSAWMTVGGSETLLSYGIRPPRTHDPAAWEEASNQLLTSMPIEHLVFYEELAPHHQEGDYHFVHAGVRHGVPLDAQAPEDTLWIRDSFLKDTRTFEKMIVHGHTPGPDIYSDHRRICLDTGSYATGVLSAIRLEGTARVILQTRRAHGKVKFYVTTLASIEAGKP